MLDDEEAEVETAVLVALLLVRVAEAVDDNDKEELRTVEVAVLAMTRVTVLVVVDEKVRVPDTDESWAATIEKSRATSVARIEKSLILESRFFVVKWRIGRVLRMAF